MADPNTTSVLKEFVDRSLSEIADLRAHDQRMTAEIAVLRRDAEDCERTMQRNEERIRDLEDWRARHGDRIVSGRDDEIRRQKDLAWGLLKAILIGVGGGLGGYFLSRL